MFTHFLITRFNLRKKDWNTDKNNQPVLDDNWLRHRLFLFENYCLPSVLEQSQKEFQWLIFFQKDSQNQLGSILKKMKKYDFIEPIFVKNYEYFQENIGSIIEERIPNSTNLVITTRLDNDDAIHMDFIKEIQKKSAEFNAKDTILHFPNGLSLDVSHEPKLSLNINPLNPFLSLLENYQQGAVRTVYACEHNNWNNDLQFWTERKEPMWVEIIHGKNKLNTFKGDLVHKKALKKFRILIPDFPFFYFLVVFKNNITGGKELPGKYFLKRLTRKTINRLSVTK